MTDVALKPAKPTCFIISPIGKDGSDVRKAADQVLKHLIRKTLGDDFTIVRGDEDPNPGSITAQIIQSILDADLVIADLSGFNPNVYYEVAVAHGYDRPTVHIQRADETPAFDLKDMRLVQYNLHDPDELEKSQKALKEFTAFVMATPDKAKTPLADARRFAQIADSFDPVAESNAEVIEQLRSLRTEVRRAIRGTTPRSSTPPDFNRANVASLRKIIEHAAARGALLPADLDSAITRHTSEKFDDWAREILAGIIDETDPETLNEVLFDAEVLEMSSDPDD